MINAVLALNTLGTTVSTVLVPVSTGGGGVPVGTGGGGYVDSWSAQQQLQHLVPLSPESVAGFSAAALTVTKNYLRIEVQDSGVGELSGSLFYFLAYVYYILMRKA